MNSENKKGLAGTILFHGFLLLCIFLMSFAEGGGGGGDNGTGEALGGMEVSLGEPDLGGYDDQSGYTPPEEVAPTEAPDDQTLTDDNANTPEIKSSPSEKKTIVPKITAPKVKESTPNTTPAKPIPGLKFKAGNKGPGIKPGAGGEDNGSIDSDGDGKGDGDGDGKPGDGPGSGPGKGPGDGPGDGPGTHAGKGVNFGLRGFRSARPFNIDPKKSISGTVVIKLCVNKDGSIRSVDKTLKGNITDSYFINLALEAVRNNSYLPTGSEVVDPCGYVTFRFTQN